MSKAIVRRVANKCTFGVAVCVETAVVLEDGEMATGYHTVEWHAAEAAIGVCYYHMIVGKFRQVRRMMLVR